MNDSPFLADKGKLVQFSFVLPTKNRAHLLESCVPCLLRQTFEDFELIVIDNDDSEDTSKFVATISDPRVSLVRTGGLNMPRNWQVALASGRGRYVIVVEDKMHFRRNALELIAKAIDETNADIVTWKFEQFHSLSELNESFVARVEHGKVISTEEIMISARKGEWRLMGWAGPRGLNSAIRRSCLEEFEEKWGVPASRELSPDYTLVFSFLMTRDRLTFVDSILANVLSNSLSTGGAGLVRGASSLAYLRDIGMTEEDCTTLLPVKYVSPFNGVYSDMLRTAKLLRKVFPIDEASYFKNLSEEIFVGEDMGGDLRENRAHLIKVFREQPVALQMKTLKYIVEQTFIKVRNGYPLKKAVLRSYHQLKNLGFLPF